MGDSKHLRVCFAVNTHPGSSSSCRCLGRRLERMDGQRRGSGSANIGGQPGRAGCLRGGLRC